MVEQNSPDCQDKSEAVLDSEGFFKRLCLALHTESTTEIARKVGLTKSAINLWKKGHMPGATTLQNVVRAANVANVRLEWLLTGIGEEATSRTPWQSAANVGAFLLNTYFTPEVADELRQRAGNSGVQLCELISLLTRKGLASEGHVRQIAEIEAAYSPSTPKRKKRDRNIPPVPDGVAGADADKKAAPANGERASTTKEPD